MIEPALPYLFKIQLKLLYIRVNQGIVFYFSYLNVFVFTYNGHFFIFQINGIFCELNKRRSVTGYKEFIFANTNGQGAAQASNDNFIWFCFVKNSNGIGANNLV